MQPVLGGGEDGRHRGTARPQTVLAIGGSDSSAGAGIQADLKTLCALGVYGLTALTSVTAQSRDGLEHRFDLPVATIEAQIDAAIKAGPIQAVKVGMLGSIAAADVVLGRLSAHGIKEVVLDPVATATAGGNLGAVGLTEHFLADWLPYVALLTPNRDEAEMLSGLTISTPDDARTAAASLVEAGARAVLITGLMIGDESVDYLADADEHLTIFYKRLPHDAHGTGCTLSAAVAGHLARGLTLTEAVREAGRFVHRSLADPSVLNRDWKIVNQSADF